MPQWYILWIKCLEQHVLPHVPPKTVEVSRLSHAFSLQLSTGLVIACADEIKLLGFSSNQSLVIVCTQASRVTVALQSATVQNMGEINGFLGHKTRRQAKRIYLFSFLQILPLERNTNSSEYYCFTWKKLGPLQSFVVTSQKPPAKERCGHSLWPSLLPIPPPTPLIPPHSH